jgi:hypothetical protein
MTPFVTDEGGSAMTAHSNHARLAHLQANAHQPNVQVEIRREIGKGTIRVAPTSDGGIRIIPNHSQGGGAANARSDLT